MNMESESCCLVLSGGGTKGVYHIGVWRSLKELGILISSFVGASIGAIIAEPSLHKDSMRNSKNSGAALQWTMC